MIEYLLGASSLGFAAFAVAQSVRAGAAQAREAAAIEARAALDEKLAAAENTEAQLRAAVTAALGRADRVETVVQELKDELHAAQKELADADAVDPDALGRRFNRMLSAAHGAVPGARTSAGGADGVRTVVPAPRT